MALPQLKENELLCFMEDYHNDGCDRVIIITEAEYDAMTADAEKNRYPIDGATVDWSVLGKEDGFDRTNYFDVLTGAELRSIDCVIPMV